MHGCFVAAAYIFWCLPEPGEARKLYISVPRDKNTQASYYKFHVVLDKFILASFNMFQSFLAP
jgi:hypothetical protein